MKIAIVSSEVVPFAKTGGLADVCGALPAGLESLGHEVVIFMPEFKQCHRAGVELEETGLTFSIPLGRKIVDGTIRKAQLPGTGTTVYFIGNADFFDRDGLYGENGTDYTDNSQRFIFFSRAVVECIRMMKISPDVLHCNDWQSGLIPAILKLECAGVPDYENIATLFTIHNLAYQGSFWHWDMMLTGIDWKHFNWQEMEFHGSLNLLKTGLVFADAINTVSPTYAREIQTSEQGCGLEGVLQHRHEVLSGILNGIDTSVWNPSLDPHIAMKFDLSNYQEGKAACKSALQQSLGLEVDPDKPLIGIVGRLAAQKGWSLILSVMKSWLENHDVQWAILGTGDPDYHAVLTSMHRSWPTKLGLALDFSNPLAHQIEAGSDMFLMPSEYEPCGLNQMYSMAYGTIPVVRETGGLADTVVNATPETVAAGRANGFSFAPFTSEALESAVARAVAMFREDRDRWNTLIENGMSHDWSWQAGAERYAGVYASLTNGARSSSGTA